MQRSHAAQLSLRSCRRVAHACPKWSAEGLGHGASPNTLACAGPEWRWRANSPSSCIGCWVSGADFRWSANVVAAQRVSHEEFPLRAGSYVPAGTMAMVRSSDALRRLTDNALSTLIANVTQTRSCGRRQLTSLTTSGRVAAGIPDRGFAAGDPRRHRA